MEASKKASNTAGEGVEFYWSTRLKRKKADSAEVCK